MSLVSLARSTLFGPDGANGQPTPSPAQQALLEAIHEVRDEAADTRAIVVELRQALGEALEEIRHLRLAGADSRHLEAAAKHPIPAAGAPRADLVGTSQLAQDNPMGSQRAPGALLVLAVLALLLFAGLGVFVAPVFFFGIMVTLGLALIAGAGSLSGTW